MTKSEKVQPSFEALMTRIEELTEKLEDPATDIEQSLGLYEEAMQVVATAQSRLAEIQHKFEIIQKGTSDPNIVPKNIGTMFPGEVQDSSSRQKQQEETDDSESAQKTLL